MSTATMKQQTGNPTDWVSVARRLSERFGERAAGHDANGEFVAENYQDLREEGLFWAGIPAELGGGGATFEDLCDVIRTLAGGCGSTALSFVMHTHPVFANVFRYLRDDEAAAGALRTTAGKRLVIATTGANDWLSSSGEAERVPGGFRVSAHKRFVSGAPGAQLFVTSVHHATDDGGEVLHFATPFDSEGVTMVDTWNALGMRGTGSHDVILDGVFVPDASIVLRRPAGTWHPVWDVITPTALPLIAAAYVGLAEAAAEHAITAAGFRRDELAPVVGEMMNALTIARITLADMIRANGNHGFTPSMALSNEIFTRKSIVNDTVRATVELAVELVGGPGFIHGHPVERIARDVRAMHFHPLPKRRQAIFSGRLALGFDPIGE
jgi:acyl-CoA dehydrogenase